MRVGFLGPAGTFSEAAVRASGAAEGAELVALPTIVETVEAVRDGLVDRALVPIENALEGGISATLDALTRVAPAVGIVGEHVLAIRTCLIARGPLDLERIDEVLSHPQPLGQCARWLQVHLPGTPLRATTSTAEAVRQVAEHDGPWAALGPRSAAERYGCEILRDGVDDDVDNATRFVWLARTRDGVVVRPVADERETGTSIDHGDAWKTSVVFTGAGDAQPGWLVRCLSEFAFRGVNLTRIESRPRRSGLGHYLFHVDLEGRADADDVAAALVALRTHCEEVLLLGTYPAA